MGKRGQISIEYMFIIGFATIVSIPLLAIYYQYSSQSSDSVTTAQALQVARKIADSSESVYYLGKPSQTTLKMNFPAHIIISNISGREIIFKVKTASGLTDVVQVTSMNLSGSLPTSEGIHIVTLQAQDSYVQVSSN